MNGVRKMLTMPQEQFALLCPMQCESYGVTLRGNPYGVAGFEVYIGLTRNNYCIVDDDDFEKVTGFRWTAHKGKGTFYASTTLREGGKKITLRMHHLILGEKTMTDHKNGNGLDNRRSNLRRADHVLNGLNRRKQKNNTSGYANVYWHEKSWCAHLKVNGVDKCLGHFISREEASACVEKRRLEVIKQLEAAADGEVKS